MLGPSAVHSNQLAIGVDKRTAGVAVAAGEHGTGDIDGKQLGKSEYT